MEMVLLPQLADWWLYIACGAPLPSHRLAQTRELYLYRSTRTD